MLQESPCSPFPFLPIPLLKFQQWFFEQNIGAQYDAELHDALYRLYIAGFGVESDPAEVQSGKLYVKVKDGETGEEKVEAAPIFKRIPRPKSYPDWLSEDDVRASLTVVWHSVPSSLLCGL